MKKLSRQAFVMSPEEVLLVLTLYKLVLIISSFFQFCFAIWINYMNMNDIKLCSTLKLVENAWDNILVSIKSNHQKCTYNLRPRP